MQEQSLLDAHERMEMLENKSKAGEQALAQIRSILSTAQGLTQDQSLRYNFNVACLCNKSSLILYVYGEGIVFFWNFEPVFGSICSFRHLYNII